MTWEKREIPISSKKIAPWVLTGEEKLEQWGYQIALKEQGGTLFSLTLKGEKILSFLLQETPFFSKLSLLYLSINPTCKEISIYLEEAINLIIKECEERKLKTIELFVEERAQLHECLLKKGFIRDEYPIMQRFYYEKDYSKESIKGYSSPWMKIKTPTLPKGFSLVPFKNLSFEQINLLNKNHSIPQEVQLDNIKEEIDENLSFFVKKGEEIVGYSVVTIENPQGIRGYKALYMKEGIKPKLSFLTPLIASTESVLKNPAVTCCFFEVFFLQARAPWLSFVKKHLQKSTIKTPLFYIYSKNN